MKCLLAANVEGDALPLSASVRHGPTSATLFGSQTTPMKPLLILRVTSLSWTPV